MDQQRGEESQRPLVAVHARLLGVLDLKSPARHWLDRLVTVGLLCELGPGPHDPAHPRGRIARLQVSLSALEEAEEGLVIARHPDPFRTGQAPPWILPAMGATVVLLAIPAGFWVSLATNILLWGAVAAAGLLRLWTIEDQRRKAVLLIAEARLAEARKEIQAAALHLRSCPFALDLGDRLVVCCPEREALVARRDQLPPGHPERAEVARRARELTERIEHLRRSPPADWTDEGLGAPLEQASSPVPPGEASG